MSDSGPDVDPIPLTAAVIMSVIGPIREEAYQLLTGEDDGPVCRDIPETGCGEQPGTFLKHALSLTLTGTGDRLADGGTVLGLLALFALARSFASVSYKDVLGRTVAKTTRGTATGTAGSLIPYRCPYPAGPPWSISRAAPSHDLHAPELHRSDNGRLPGTPTPLPSRDRTVRNQTPIDRTGSKRTGMDPGSDGDDGSPPRFSESPSASWSSAVPSTRA